MSYADDYGLDVEPPDYWRDKKGEIWYPEQMSTQYLEATIKFIEKKKIDHWPIYNLLQNELSKRQYE
jgi:hypothetical protein